MRRAPKARHLVEAGHAIATVLNRSPFSFGLQAEIFGSRADVARVADVVITKLPDPPDADRVRPGTERLVGWAPQFMSACAALEGAAHDHPSPIRAIERTSARHLSAERT